MIAGRLKKRAMDAAVVLIVTAASLHFAHSALMGPSGLNLRLRLDKELGALAAEKSALESERARLANLTRRMSPDYLDLDLLDEQARRVLGHIRPDEVVVR